jgi:hypothetical protein
VPDAWNELLYALILRSSISQEYRIGSELAASIAS